MSPQQPHASPAAHGSASSTPGTSSPAPHLNSSAARQQPHASSPVHRPPPTPALPQASPTTESRSSTTPFFQFNSRLGVLRLRRMQASPSREKGLRHAHTCMASCCSSSSRRNAAHRRRRSLRLIASSSRARSLRRLWFNFLYRRIVRGGYAQRHSLIRHARPPFTPPPKR